MNTPPDYMSALYQRVKQASELAYQQGCAREPLSGLALEAAEETDTYNHPRGLRRNCYRDWYAKGLAETAQ